MKLILLLCLGLSSSVFADSSKVIPKFLAAAEIYLSSPEDMPETQVLQPEVAKIVRLLAKAKISPERLEKYIEIGREKSEFKLPPSDEFDRWQDPPKGVKVPEIALHAYKFDVVEDSDDFFNDDIYVYFFVTDGLIPTGKVSSIYKGIDQGQSFFFDEVDRAIFPLIGIPSKRPDRHLIVDYGIVESDGDDIKELQQISSIIIDIAIAVYASYDPQNAEILIKLRKEIKALADLLLALNHDDRLETSSFGYKAEDLENVFGGNSYVEFKRNHKKSTNFGSWEYNLHFRLLR